MTKQEIIDYMYKNHVQGDFKIEEMAEDFSQPDLQPTCNQLATDTVSRQDAKDAIDMALDHIDHVPPWVYDKLLNALNEVPSAEKAQLFGEDATSELISRQDAIDAIHEDIDWLATQGGRDLDLPECMERAKSILENLPSAEPEIIRCKDCKYWYKDADSGMSCEYTEMRQPEDGFCNWAERRGDPDE